MVEISNDEYLQAKRWLLYKFNKSSSFSDILVSCLLKHCTKELSLWHRYIPLVCEVELVTKTLNLNRKVSYLYIVKEVIFFYCSRNGISHGLGKSY